MIVSYRGLGPGQVALREVWRCVAIDRARKPTAGCKGVAQQRLRTARRGGRDGLAMVVNRACPRCQNTCPAAGRFTARPSLRLRPIPSSRFEWLRRLKK